MKQILTKQQKEEVDKVDFNKQQKEEVDEIDINKATEKKQR